ncbi:MAG: ribosome-associated translation inhibitor RaiA [Ignavibacteriaceae bacterium]|nr:ribosome-associated translation inhibitor RaiA [Ignavibacteriaceae bacterium]
MNVTITARKFKAHATLKEFIHSELKSLDKYGDEILDVDVVLSFQNSKDSIKTAEVILHVPGQVLAATEDSDDFKKSVTASILKIEKQLAKIKTKRSAARIK